MVAWIGLSESVRHSTHIHFTGREQFLSGEFKSCQGPGDWRKMLRLDETGQEVGKHLQLLVMQLVDESVPTLRGSNVKEMDIQS